MSESDLGDEATEDFEVDPSDVPAEEPVSDDEFMPALDARQNDTVDDEEHEFDRGDIRLDEPEA